MSAQVMLILLLMSSLFTLKLCSGYDLIVNNCDNGFAGKGKRKSIHVQHIYGITKVCDSCNWNDWIPGSAATHTLDTSYRYCYGVTIATTVIMSYVNF